MEPNKTLPKWVEWAIIIGLTVYAGAVMIYKKVQEPSIQEIEFTKIGELVPINNDQTIQELQIKKR